MDVTFCAGMDRHVRLESARTGETFVTGRTFVRTSILAFLASPSSRRRRRSCGISIGVVDTCFGRGFKHRTATDTKGRRAEAVEDCRA